MWNYDTRVIIAHELYCANHQVPDRAIHAFQAAFEAVPPDQVSTGWARRSAGLRAALATVACTDCWDGEYLDENGLLRAPDGTCTTCAGAGAGVLPEYEYLTRDYPAPHTAVPSSVADQLLIR